MRRKTDDEDLDEFPDNPLPDEEGPVREPPPLDEDPESPRYDEINEARFRWVEAINYWQRANEEVAGKRYENAEVLFDESSKAAVRYFEKFYSPPNSPVTHLSIPFGIDAKDPIEDKIRKVVIGLWNHRFSLKDLWLKVRWRRDAITLGELQRIDWSAFYSMRLPNQAHPDKLLDVRDVLNEDKDPSTNELSRIRLRQEGLDFFALILATVLVPLARAEMNRVRRNYDAAIEEYERLLTPYQQTNSLANIWLTCDFIERPFILLTLGETLLEKAEVQFKSAGQGEADDAKATYEQIATLFSKHGHYADQVAGASTELLTKVKTLIDEPLHKRELATRVFGKGINIAGIESRTLELPGLSPTKAPAESWLKFGSDAIVETNPRIFSLLLNAEARKLQIDQGFNYLGYKDDYVPPWRFQFLLERARYFAEHSKNAQRDYLNFLNNAEQEDFKELSASQAVEMEKANVTVETVRVSQAGLEVDVARASFELARGQASMAQDRFKRYRQIDQYLRDKEFDALETSQNKSLFGAFIGAASAGLGFSGGGGGAAGGLGGIGGLANSVFDLLGTSEQQVGIAQAQQNRSFELFNLGAAIPETQKAKEIAAKQHRVAQIGLVVASLQRQAALLRHEFAIQNLQYLRNRTLNSEQWFRLASAIRSVAETYLRYAIELAFLAEQAYEFEADKRINAIRFDYDQSELGAFLAADFLLRDLDTVEQDFIVSQKQRHQEVRYVVSLARDFPDALENLRAGNPTTFLLRLEQLERRFPGLYNARIGMVDVMPVALMDSTRFSLDLTHSGVGQTRIKGKPDVPIDSETPSKSVLNVDDLPGYRLSDYALPGVELPDITLPAYQYDWRQTPIEMWPVKFLVTEPQTAIYSGLSRQDGASAFPVAATSQRNAFEGLGVAGAWNIDMSSRDNEMVPGSLADILITFTISGYHDLGLRAAIQGASAPANALTAHLSARRVFPDAFFEFNRSGRMTWNVTREMLSLTDSLGPLHNIAVLLMPGPTGSNYMGRVICQRTVRLRTSNQGIEILNSNPRAVYLFDNENSLEVTARCNIIEDHPPASDRISWDFGDGTPRQFSSGADLTGAHVQKHAYAKPGRYVVTLRVERNRRFN